MRSALVVSLLLALLIAAGGATARAESLSGTWTATYSGHPLTLHLTGSGNSYSGTYTLTTKYTVKKVQTTKKETLQIKASVKVVKQVTNVLLTFVKVKATSACVLTKGTLRCLAPATQKIIVFKHV